MSPPSGVAGAPRASSQLWTRGRRRLAAVALLILATGVTQAIVVGTARAVPGDGLLDRLPKLAALDLSPDRFGNIAPLRPDFVAAQAPVTAPRAPHPARHAPAAKAPAPVVPVTTNVTLPSLSTTSTTVAPVVKPKPRLVVSIQADESAVRRGDQIEYTIEVHNVGDAGYSGTATVLSHIPYGTVKDSGDGDSVTGSSDPNTHQITASFTFSNRHALRPGDVASYHFTVRVRNTVKSGTLISNHAHLSQDGAADQTTDPVQVTVE